MLLHDTQLKYDSHRTGTSDTPQCDCGMAAETVEHFLLHCCKYYNERQEMLDFINDIGCGPKYKGCLHVSEKMLLSPMAKNSKYIKYPTLFYSLITYINDSQLF